MTIEAGSESLRRLLDEVVARPPSPDDPRIDGLAPALVLEPESEDACARAMALCHREGMAVVPVGGGTRLDVGNAPKRLDAYLSTAALHGVEDHIPGDLTVAVRAGTPLASLQRVLAEAGQFLPLEPPLSSRATIGGIFSLGEPGIRRRPGARPRDLLLGFEGVLSDGTPIHAGGRVVKNVAGYELVKLLVGSAGTLCIMTRGFLRLRALPEAVRTLALTFPRTEAAASAFREISREPVLPEAAALLSPTSARALGFDDWMLLLRFEGFAEEAAEGVERARARRAALSDVVPNTLWERVSDFPVKLLGDDDVLLRGQVSPARTFELASRWQDGGPLVAHPDGGIVYSHTEDRDALSDRAEAARILGGNVVVERASPVLKQELDVFGEVPGGFELMKKIKERLDPAGILSPGRFVGKL